MEPPISRSLVAQAQALARAEPGREVCGLLLGADGRVHALRPAANVADDPATAFEIDPATLIAAHRAARAGGVQVIGCYHSHPTGRAEPSPRDIAGAAVGQLWLILAADGARLFRFDVNGFVELSLRTPGRAPCLARDPPP